ncbi:ammonia-dependent NAD(+) synthetase [Ensifer canadensis]
MIGNGSADEQFEIIRALGVPDEFDAEKEARERIAFLAGYLRQANARAYVLGISGGVDSLTAGLLAQAAVRALREDGYRAQFIAVRLPYGTQADEAAARACLAAINPDLGLEANVKPAADALFAEVRKSAGDLFGTARDDFHLGNVKARQRMIYQYAIAGAANGLVIGTDHAAEALMGFFTKHGDGAADVVPLSGLNKRRVRAIATYMGAPYDLVSKVPTADLETDAPLKPDEEVYGIGYDAIDDFLEGKTINKSAAERILAAYRASGHKRALPIGPAFVADPPAAP